MFIVLTKWKTDWKNGDLIIKLMDEEYARFRQASFKGKFIISKKFTKYYFNQFQPITKLEEVDVQRSRNFYRAFTVGGAVLLGYMSFKLRRIKIGALEVEGTPRD